MFKTVHHTVWAFDCEWVPDPESARRLLGLSAETPDDACLRALWQQAEATPENPEPFLKPALCRMVAIAAVQRIRHGDAPARVTLTWLPRDASDFAGGGEAAILRRFLEAVGHHKPQLVGYNSLGADLRVLVQRALIHGLSLPEFCKRPDKPWDGVDYFARGGEYHIDLMETAAGTGRAAAPSLHELALLCGIPGKPAVEGGSVASLWLEGRLADIVEQCAWGALTTYLLWLRAAHLGGFLDAAAYSEEQDSVRALLAAQAEQGVAVAARYAAAWAALSSAGVGVGSVAEPPIEWAHASNRGGF